MWKRTAGLGFFLLICILVTARTGDGRLYPGAPGASRARIYLIDNGFHTDLALPRAALTGRSDALGAAVSATTNQPWVVLGWGDEGFFTARGVSAARALDGLRALFAPGNASVVRIEGLPRAPDRVYVAQAVRGILVTDAGLRALEARAAASLALDPRGRPLPGPRTREPDTAFFRSVEHFSILHVCNHWTAELLHAAGLPTTPMIDTLPAGLRFDLSWRARA